jgi:ribosomal protein S18 acetylase RimI-like enzyme
MVRLGFVAGMLLYLALWSSSSRSHRFPTGVLLVQAVERDWIEAALPGQQQQTAARSDISATTPATAAGFLIGPQEEELAAVPNKSATTTIIRANSSIRIQQATLDHLNDLVPLFDGYRQFFQQPSDLVGARTFLAQRLAKHDAVIFMAYSSNQPNHNHNSNNSSSSSSSTSSTSAASASASVPLETSRHLDSDGNHAEIGGTDTTTTTSTTSTTTTPVGFVLLYESFLSVSLRQVWILEDLFVAPTARQLGVAQALLQRAEAFAESTGAEYLSLETATGNVAAQSLFERRNWERDDEFYTYYYTCSSSSMSSSSSTISPQ